MPQLPVILLLLFATLFPSTATAQGRTGAKLSARMQQRTSTARAGTPTTIVWDFKWTGVEILEGHIELTVTDGRETLGRLKTDDVVIATGERRLETRLPVFSTEGIYAQATLHATLVTPERKFALGEFQLRLRPYGTRRFAIGVCDPWQYRFSARQQQIVRSFQFERFSPDAKTPSIRTSMNNIPPNEMPSDALGYCAFNFIVLMDEGFTDLRPKQLDAIYDWVAAGGSLCVLPGGSLGNEHLNFLARLSARDPQAAPFVPDSDGRLIPDDEPSIRMFLPGMGRAAVVLTANEEQRLPDSSEWRAMVASLWNVHYKLIPQLVEEGDWEDIPTRSHRGEMGYGPGAAQQSFEYQSIQQGGWLLERLMPESVKVVPLALIGLILAGYVLLIGPVDYFLLGLIKQRKLTWLLFPLVTIGVATFTVALSQWYMQPTEDRRTVEYIDVGDDNEIARRSRFELLFTSTARDITTEVNGEIFAALNQQRFSLRAQQQQMQYGYGGEEIVEQLVGVADYTGRIPNNYTVTQHIPQWTPQINRRFRIGAAEKESDDAADKFDWHSLRPSVSVNMADAVQQQSWRTKVRQQVQQHFGNGAAIWVMSEGNIDQIAGSHGLFSHRRMNQYDRWGNTTADWSTSEANAGGPTDFLAQTCRRPQFGLYSLVSRIAPTGGDTFEDLAILDPTDPRQCLIVVVVEDEGNLRIYRKLYFLE